jgi:hypothetical protein
MRGACSIAAPDRARCCWRCWRTARGDGVGIDRSAAALAVARGNAARLGLAGRARMILADWEAAGWAEALGEAVRPDPCQPPLCRGRWRELAPSVRAHEPAGALFAGPEGLDAYRVLVPQLPGLLAPGGLALVEIGAAQADAVGHRVRRAGWAPRLHRDLANRPRALQNCANSVEFSLGSKIRLASGQCLSALAGIRRRMHASRQPGSTPAFARAWWQGRALAQMRDHGSRAGMAVAGRHAGWRARG